jgi:hypothetical protein
VSEVEGPLPWVDRAELEAQRPLLRDSEFARLHLNLWSQSEDRLVSEEDLDHACILAGSLDPSPGVRYVVSADLGLKRDRTVCVVAHSEPSGPESGAPRRVVVDRLQRWQGSRRQPVEIGQVEAWLEQASKMYHNAPVHADPWQSVGIVQRLNARGVRASEFTFSQQSVGRLANQLHVALRNRLLLLPDDQDLRAELGRVRLRETSPGVVRLDHDSGEHDDQAVAVGIAVSVLMGESRVGSGWVEAWTRERDSRGPAAPAGLAHLPKHPAADERAPLGRGCQHRFRRWPDGECCLQCGGWREVAA